jgi:hypothetical protein
LLKYNKIILSGLKYEQNVSSETLICPIVRYDIAIYVTIYVKGGDMGSKIQKTSSSTKLAAYVRSVMKERGLNANIIRRKSDFTITAGYVHKITEGKARNLSPLKQQALAKGLGVKTEEIAKAMAE